VNALTSNNLPCMSFAMTIRMRSLDANRDFAIFVLFVIHGFSPVNVLTVNDLPFVSMVICPSRSVR
jgi:hypothetical protein